MRRSKRFEKLDRMPVNLDGIIEDWNEAGLTTMHSPYDPAPSIRVENGVIVEMDGKQREEFDSLDFFIADYGIDRAYAREAMKIPSLEIARMLVDINVPQGKDHEDLRGIDTGEDPGDHESSECSGDDDGSDEDAGTQDAGQSVPLHECG